MTLTSLCSCTPGKRTLTHPPISPRRAQQARDEYARYTKMHDSLKRELDVIQASAAAV